MKRDAAKGVLHIEDHGPETLSFLKVGPKLRHVFPMLEGSG